MTAQLVDRSRQLETFPVEATKRFAVTDVAWDRDSRRSYDYPWSGRGLLLGEGDTREAALEDCRYRGNAHLVEHLEERTLRSIYTVVRDDRGMQRALVIRDENGKTSITNDAEAVVERLYMSGRLPVGRRLFYFDSEGRLDELLHDDAGRFVGYASGPESQRLEDVA